MGRKFMGKSHLDKYVLLSPRSVEYELMFQFPSKEEALDYYDLFDWKKRKMSIFHEIKLFLCKHPNEKALYFDSPLFHYLHCPECNRATYVNDESTEDRRIRMNKGWQNARKSEIREAEQELALLKGKYKEVYGEEYDDVLLK